MSPIALARREASCIDCDIADAARYPKHRRKHLLDAQGRLQMLAAFIADAVRETETPEQAAFRIGYERDEASYLRKFS